jgi:hypothetical protein
MAHRGGPDSDEAASTTHSVSALAISGLMQKSIRAFCIWSQRKAWFSLSPEIKELELVDFAGPSVARTSRVLQRVLHHPARVQIHLSGPSCTGYESAPLSPEDVTREFPG